MLQILPLVLIRPQNNKGNQNPTVYVLNIRNILYMG